MSDTTKIEWATSTGNPWIGCTKVSPGCKNCYAETLDKQRFSRTMGGGTKDKPVSHWGPGAPRFRTKGFWKDALKWNREFAEWRDQLCAPHLRQAVEEHAKRIRPRIFPSLCDWLDDEVPIEWLADFLKLIHDTPNLDWLLLTKRPEKWGQRLAEACHEGGSVVRDFVKSWRWGAGLFPNNVWIGVSVEDQQRADERIPELLKIPAKVRFLSVEPLLGPVRLSSMKANWGGKLLRPVLFDIDWVIVGGESGKGARPCDVQWIRSIGAQCQSASVPCFVKQLGSNPRSLPTYCGDGSGMKLRHPKGGDLSEWPQELRVRDFPVVR